MQRRRQPLGPALPEHPAAPRGASPVRARGFSAAVAASLLVHGVAVAIAAAPRGESAWGDAPAPLVAEGIALEPRTDDEQPGLAGESAEATPPGSPGDRTTANAAAGTAANAAASTAANAAAGTATSFSERSAAPARVVPRGRRGAKGSPQGQPVEPALFGAVGERGAVPLATAFTRAFPSVASADPTWARVPFGAAGTADVTLVLDEGGHLVSQQVSGAPSPALAEGVRRTLALLKARTFVARGRTTRLRVRAAVSADTVHDGLHGDVFAIGASFQGNAGNAFFALAIGRRVDLVITEVR